MVTLKELGESEVALQMLVVRLKSVNVSTVRETIGKAKNVALRIRSILPKEPRSISKACRTLP